MLPTWAWVSAIIVFFPLWYLFYYLLFCSSIFLAFVLALFVSIGASVEAANKMEGTEFFTRHNQKDRKNKENK